MLMFLSSFSIPPLPPAETNYRGLACLVMSKSGVIPDLSVGLRRGKG